MAENFKQRVTCELKCGFCSQYLMKGRLIAVRHDVNNFESSVVVHELAIKCALYGPLCSLGKQYNMGSISW